MIPSEEKDSLYIKPGPSFQRQGLANSGEKH